MNQNKKFFIILFIIIVFQIISSNCEREKQIKLVEIEGDEIITVKNFEDAYKTILEQIKATTRIDDKKLDEFRNMTKAEVASLPPQYQELWYRIQRDAAFEDMKRMKIINRKAREDGFTKRDDIIKKVKLLTEQAIMQLYLLETIKITNFTDQQIESECIRIRQSAPDNPQIQGMTASQCEQQAKASLVMNEQQLEIVRLVKTITEGYRVTVDNEAVDKYIHGKKGTDDSKSKKKKKGKKGEKDGPDEKDEKKK